MQLRLNYPDLLSICDSDLLDNLILELLLPLGIIIEHAVEHCQARSRLILWDHVPCAIDLDEGKSSEAPIFSHILAIHSPQLVSAEAQRS